MSNYKPVYTSIWSDIKFTEYTAEQQLIFLYLITNSSCKVSGIYQVSPKEISFKTNIDKNLVKDSLSQFDKETLEYDSVNGIVFVKNYFKYNLNSIGNPKVMHGALMKNLSLVCHPLFWKKFNEKYEEQINILKAKIAFKSDNKKDLTLNQDLDKTKPSLDQDFYRDSNRDRDRISNKKEIDKNLEKDFKEVYLLFKQSDRIRVIPFKENKTKFSKCVKALGDGNIESGINELKKQITHYLTYLGSVTWSRRKKAFDAWINNPESYANDWEAELKQESKSEEQKKKDNHKSHEPSKEDLEALKRSKKIMEFAKSKHCNPRDLTEEEILKITGGL